MIQPGTVIDGKYRVERKLGEGGMATVYAATHVNLGERVAIKVLLPGVATNPTVVERFLREARAAVRLKSDHIIRVLDVGSLPSQQPYIVMEFLDGKDLEELLKVRNRLPPGETVDYILQVCSALAEAHGAGIVHRDIKPANLVLTTRPDGQPLVKVLDFGIAKMTLADAGPALTATQATMGTPAFMSPEQIRGAKDVDHRGDIWALGVSLFQLVTGNVPFYGNTYAKLVITITRDPTPDIPTIAPGLNAVIQRCLAKDRAQRYQNVAELAQELEPFAGDRREAAMIAERCAALVRVHHARVAATAAGVGAATIPKAAAPSPGYGVAPPGAPMYGSQPMNTPAHGMPPGHQVNPMVTPPQGMHPMNPMVTPSQGMYPMQPNVTPPHGMPPGQAPYPAPYPSYPPPPLGPMGQTGPQLPHPGQIQQGPYAPPANQMQQTGPFLPHPSQMGQTGPSLPTNVATPATAKGRAVWFLLMALIIGGAITLIVLLA